MLARLEGKTIAEIAVKYDCSPSTAERFIRHAHDHGLYLDKARQLIETNLLPRALAVYESYLNGERDGITAHDLDAAKDILFGLGVLSKSTTVKHAANEDTLDSFRASYFNVEAVPLPALPEAPLEAAGPPLDGQDKHVSTYQSPRRLADLHDEDSEDE